MRILASPALFLLSLATAGILLGTAQAAQQTFWQGPPGTVGDWFEAANWTDGLPTDGDYQNIATIDNGGAARVAAGTAKSGQLYLGETLAGELIVDGGRVDILYNAYLGMAPNAVGRLTLNGGVFAAESLLMGYDVGRGEVEQTGGLLDAEFLQLGTPNGFIIDLTSPRTEPQDYGSGSYHLQGGRLTATQVQVGNSGVGIVRQDGGTAIIEQRLTVGGAIASLPPFEDGPTTWIPDAPVVPVPFTPVLDYSTDLWIPPPVPSNGRYELAGGSLSTRQLQIATTGTVQQTGGSLDPVYLEVSPGGSYVYEGGSLHVESGLHSDGGFDFAGSSAKLTAGNAILNFAAGLPNAQHARIEAGPNSLTILPANFNSETQLGSLTTQGIVHIAGNDLTIPLGRTVEGWGRIEDHIIVAGSIKAVDELASISLNGLELLAGGSIQLHRGTLHVTNDRTVIRGGSLAAEGISVDGRVDLSPVITNGYRLPVYTPGLARQTAGSVDVDYLSISNGRYEISGGMLVAGSMDVGGGTRSLYLGAGPNERTMVQTGGTVVTRNLSLSMPYLTYFSRVNRSLSVDGLPPFTASSFDRTARHQLHGGLLQAERVNVGFGFLGSAAEFIQTGGEFHVSQFLSVTGEGNSYVMTGGSLHTRRLYVGGALNTSQPDGAFSILDRDAQVTVAGELLFGTKANFAAVPGAKIHLTRPASPVPYEFPTLTGNNVAIHATNSDALSGLSNLTLVFEGGADLASTLEAAGEDRGPSLAGFYQNFTLDTLVIGGVEPAALSLVDLVANQIGATIPNAVYVEHLVINAGSTLDLNGLKLYYRTAAVAAGEALALGSYGTQVVPEPSAAFLLVAAAPWGIRRRFRWRWRSGS